MDNRLCLLSLQSLLSVGQMVLTGLFADKFPDDDEKYKVFSERIQSHTFVARHEIFGSLINTPAFLCSRNGALREVRFCRNLLFLGLRGKLYTFLKKKIKKNRD